MPAIIDGVIAVNHVMHNTMWVPGHFHMYLTLGLVAMLFAFMYYLTDQGSRRGIDRIAFWLYLVAGVGFSVGLLASGYDSIPRRFAEHMPEWVADSQLSSVFAAAIVVAALVFAIRFLSTLKNARAG